MRRSGTSSGVQRRCVAMRGLAVFRPIVLGLLASKSAAAFAEPPRCFEVTREAFGVERQLSPMTPEVPEITAGLEPCGERSCRFNISVGRRHAYYVPDISIYDRVTLCISQGTTLLEKKDKKCNCHVDHFYLFISFAPVIRTNWPEQTDLENRPESALATDMVTVDYFRDRAKSLYDCFGLEVPDMGYFGTNGWMAGPYRVYVQSLPR